MKRLDNSNIAMQYDECNVMQQSAMQQSAMHYRALNIMKCNRSTEINDVGKSYSWREKEKALNSSDDCYLNPSAQYLVELQTDLRIKSICLYCARNKQLRFIKLQNVSLDHG